MLYNATVLFDRRLPVAGDDEWTDRVIDHLVGFGPVVSRLATGRAELIITLPADDLRTAIATALALARDATGDEPVGIEVVTTAEFDRRNSQAPVPELLSVTQVAETLGVTRQAVLQRIESGSLPAQRVGKGWAVSAALVEREIAARQP